MSESEQKTMLKLPQGAVQILIAINFLIFALTYLFKINLTATFALYLPENPYFHIWQFFTHMFLHGGLTHILFNMFGLWTFGTPLLRLWGNRRFLIFFLSCGLGAGLLYTGINYLLFESTYKDILALGHSPEYIAHVLETSRSSGLYYKLGADKLTQFFSLYYSPVVGASGALYGVLVAFAIIYPKAKLALLFIPYPVQARYFVPLLISGDLFFILSPYSIGNVAHLAHVGGALTGLMIMLIWLFRMRTKTANV